ncbi:MAG: VWA domain-containing protein, partial [Leptospiraceae bacterium]|nr:VWA domain-containing protein [Leptospiraceae bacterium]
EVFSDLKPDNSSSNIYKGRIEGESENVDSISRVLEFGDNISNIDYSESIIESAIRGNGTRPALNDLRVYESRGALRSSTVILLDMSGSMARGMRFYNAKKVCMSLDSLIRSEYKDENLSIIGFGTTAKRISVSDLPILQPYSVNQLEPYIKLKFDLSNIVEKEIESFIPMYFTNLQKGLKLSRQILSSSQIKNKQIILITDGVPTAHCKGSCLYINYPPRKEDFDEALFELMQCTAENIVVNTFLLTNEWDVSYFGEESFIKKFAKISRGRIFYPHPNELNKIILFDFIRNRKKLISY